MAAVADTAGNMCQKGTWHMAARIILISLIPLALWSPFAAAGGYYFVLDTPAELNGVDYSPNDILQNNNGAYSPVLALPAGLQIGALHLQSNGVWLFSPSYPFDINGTDYEPGDIVAYDGNLYSLYWKGSITGIPEDVRIDALFFGNNGRMYFSVDVPTVLEGVEYSPSDLVSYDNSGYSLLWDAEAAGVPEDVNVVGAAYDGSGQIVLSFDVPVTLDNTLFLPGQLVQWNGTTFVSYFVDNSWPSEAHLSDFALAPSSGGVSPSGAVPLTVEKAAGGNITLTWTASCSDSDIDYEVYAGTIGNYYSHVSFLCTTGGATSVTITPDPGHSYYLVVPTNTLAEGSYGKASSGVQRPQGANACHIQSIGSCGT